MNVELSGLKAVPHSDATNDAGTLGNRRRTEAAL
jgi:hypothetical protein